MLAHQNEILQQLILVMLTRFRAEDLLDQLEKLILAVFGDAGSQTDHHYADLTNYPRGAR